MKYINILFPVYNEELRLKKGILQTIYFMDSWIKNKYIITILDNASTDQTSYISQKLSNEFGQVNYIRIEQKGVGIAFRIGVANSTTPIVGYMDIDLSTDLRHLKQVVKIFKTRESVGMINASRWNKRSNTCGRKWYRVITSNGLNIILKLVFGMKATDSICGFKFFRREIAKQLIDEAGDEGNDWFYIIELLLRAERKNIEIIELPVYWKDDYGTKVEVWKVIKNYCIQIVKIRKKFWQEHI